MTFAVPPPNDAQSRYDVASVTSFQLNRTGEETFAAPFIGAINCGACAGQLAKTLMAHPAAKASRATMRSFMGLPRTRAAPTARISTLMATGLVARDSRHEWYLLPPVL